MHREMVQMDGELSALFSLNSIDVTSKEQLPRKWL